MTADAQLSSLAEHVGIFPEFTDMQGEVRQTSPETKRALLRANGLAVSSEAEVRETLERLESQQADAYIRDDVIVQSDKPGQIDVLAPVEWEILADHTGDVLAEGRADHVLRVPALPSGVHELHLTGPRGRQVSTLIAAPRSAPDLQELTGQESIWGVVAALYGLAQDKTQGIGNFSDLARLSEGLGNAGAGFLGINPVHALGWAAQETTSPYSPTHRGFLNTSHIAPEKPLQGVQDAHAEFLDYPAHVAAQRAALQAEYERFSSSASTADKAGFEQFCAQGGQPLEDFARFETLSETHGRDWRHWPDGPRNGGVKLSSDEEARRDFHLWMQWRADRQLAAAHKSALDSGMGLGLYLDLAVGARLGGAESWGRGSAGAQGVALGAPPDQLSPAGQNWQLTALAPQKLKEGRYAAFRQILAQSLRHCGVLRIDHALGLNRSYWIPEDGSPGGYIRQPFDALMAIVAVEAQRAKTLIVGEDLGLVPYGFRDRMAQGGLYGYTVLQYEKDSDGRFLDNDKLRPRSLACFGTHDTPTLRGFWKGCDIDWWEKLSWIDADAACKARDIREQEKRQLAEVSDVETNPSTLRDSVHARLASGPAALVAVQMDDILGIEQAQNLPGTVESHPNWQRRYPVTVDEMIAADALTATAEIMANAGRTGQKDKLRKESK